MIDLFVAVGVAIWLYGARISYRHEQAYAQVRTHWVSRPVAGPALCSIFWWFLLPTVHPYRPPRPWAILDPLPSSEERVERARALSLEMEREAGLAFDGIFLKDGYHYGPKRLGEPCPPWTPLLSSEELIERANRRARMADPNQSSYDPGNAPPGRQPGEPDDSRYRLTAGVARAVQRPGGLPGSTSGSPADPGRTGLASLGDAEGLMPPHTGV